MRRLFIFGFILLSAILVATLVQASIQSCKDDFKTTESVYVKSLSKICYSPDDGADVDLYVVEDKDAPLLVAISSKKIKNSQFPCVEVWADPAPGAYDIFVDCSVNGLYDPGSNEPFDNFTITAVAGKGKAEKIDKIFDSIWMNDPEDINFAKEMLKITLTAEGEDIDLQNITLKSSGTGNDIGIGSVDLYADDVLIGSAEPVYSENDGQTIIFPNLILEKGVSKTLSIVYNTQETTAEGNYSFSVILINGKGAISEKDIKFTGLPINSGVLTVLPEKTCLGKLNLSLEPNPVALGDAVVATMQELTGCENKKIVLRQNPCGSSLKEEICSCVSGDTGCACSFVFSRSQTLHACIDKNQDSDMVDFGEYDFKDLTIKEPEVEQKVEGNITEINMTNLTEKTGIEETGVTGGIISELKSKISGTSTLFILLELTLVLILVVLVMIMLRLKGPRATDTLKQSEEEKHGKQASRKKTRKQESSEPTTEETE